MSDPTSAPPRVGPAAEAPETTNRAAWLASRGGDITVGPAPHPAAGPGELVVRNRAVAVNPFDWIIDLAGAAVARWIRYPCVLGSDLAGEVVEVGAGVEGFAVGDRALALALGQDKQRNSPAEGAFQEQTVVLADLAASLPGDLSFEQAAVLPLGLATAAAGLFQPAHLRARAAEPRPRVQGRGCRGVGRVDQRRQQRHPVGHRRRLPGHHHLLGEQLRVRRPARRGHRLRLRQPDGDPRYSHRLRGATVAGALAIGTRSPGQCAAVLRATRGPKKLAMTSPPVTFDELGASSRPSRLALLRTLMRIGTGTGVLMAR